MFNFLVSKAGLQVHMPASLILMSSERWVVAALTLLIGICPFFQLEATEAPVAPPPVPLLRLENGMHTAPIRRIGLDASGKILVTASDDKTARVWDLPGGRQLMVLRPPVGADDEGKLYAIALSPDGSTVVVGGATGRTWDQSYSIYIFDRSSGVLHRRLSGFPNVITHLSFSRDGSRLAVAMAGRAGIQLLQVADGALIGQDSDYAGSCMWLDFDPSGRVVASSLDGAVRLYDSKLCRLARIPAPGGSQPYGVRFSPDGKEVALGYNDSSRVDILSSSDLSLRAQPDASNTHGCHFNIVAWSADGETLHAGGGYDRAEGGGLIRSWTQRGRGTYKDYAGIRDTVMDLVTLPEGGLVYGSADPAWGILDATGNRTQWKASSLVDFRASRGTFMVDKTGLTVQLSAQIPDSSKLPDTSPLRFDLTSRRLSSDVTANSGLEPARTEGEGISISDWRDARSVSVNGVPLPLEPHEVLRSLAIAPGGKQVLLGTEWRLRLFDVRGRSIWSRTGPGAAWAVNITGDGQVAVAAFGDGTIRFFRMLDGQEIIALYVHADRKRWVLWTPSGYYDVSAGAESLIGWQRNHGREEAATFFPIAHFRGYYRPDIIDLTLSLRNEEDALKQAETASGRNNPPPIDGMLPPEVWIESPADGSQITESEVTLTYMVRTPHDAPISDIRILIDGRPTGSTRGIELAASVDNPDSDHPRGEVRVDLPEHDCEVTLLVGNKHGMSPPATIRLKRNIPADIAEMMKPRLYMLAVGVSAYDDNTIGLGFAAKDARDFATIWKAQEGGLYRKAEARVLVDGDATKDNILDGLEWLRRETTSRDVALLFFAGHGVTDRAGIYYFLPVGGDPDHLMRSGLGFSDIKNTVADLPGKTLLFVDTCHAGSVMGKRRGTDLTGLVNTLASAENGVVVFAASTGRQSSLEDSRWQNGAFTRALVDGLEGGADYGKRGVITVNMLDLYVSERVKGITGGRQTPTTSKPETIQDFPIAVRR